MDRHTEPPSWTSCSDDPLPDVPSDMDCSLALSLFSLLALFSAGRGAPIDVNKSKIKAMAENLLNMSYKHRQDHMPDLTAVDNTTYKQSTLEGLSYVAAVLEAYQHLLHSLLDVAPVEAGVSMLRDYLKEICPGPPKKLRLDDLENTKDLYPVTVTYKALVQLEGFLLHLRENLNSLRTC